MVISVCFPSLKWVRNPDFLGQGQEEGLVGGHQLCIHWTSPSAVALLRRQQQWPGESLSTRNSFLLSREQ